jgi:hypothetical protein
MLYLAEVASSESCEEWLDTKFIGADRDSSIAANPAAPSE